MLEAVLSIILLPFAFAALKQLQLMLPPMEINKKRLVHKSESKELAVYKEHKQSTKSQWSMVVIVGMVLAFLSLIYIVESVKPKTTHTPNVVVNNNNNSSSDVIRDKQNYGDWSRGRHELLFQTPSVFNQSAFAIIFRERSGNTRLGFATKDTQCSGADDKYHSYVKKVNGVPVEFESSCYTNNYRWHDVVRQDHYDYVIEQFYKSKNVMVGVESYSAIGFTTAYNQVK